MNKRVVATGTGVISPVGHDVKTYWDNLLAGVCEISDNSEAVSIHKILHNLEEPYKEVFSLRVFSELSFKQIADIFGKTESWARVTFHRAKLKISEKLEEKYE